MHRAVKEYCLGIKHRFPAYFTKKKVIDCGSLDINGNNRYLFDSCRYIGVDIVAGKNVEIVSRVHLLQDDQLYDVVISTEMLEHDEYLPHTLAKMFSILKPGGLMILTAAGFGREEHGTHKMHPGDSPQTHDYYKNLTIEDFATNLKLEEFSIWEISHQNTDIRFFGIKKGNNGKG